jgi:hypothetical protein
MKKAIDGKNSHVHGLAELTLLKCLPKVILPKVIYRFNATPHQNPNDIPHRNRKKMLKFIWKHKRP